MLTQLRPIVLSAVTFRAVWSVALILLFGVPTHAQTAAANPPLSSGDRIRVTTTTHVVHVGGLATLDEDMIGLVSGDTIRLRISSIARLERSTGRTTLKSGAYGAFLGGLLGAGAGYLILRGVDEVMTDVPHELSLARTTIRDGERSGMLVGAAAGAGIGLFIGLIAAQETWQDIPVGSWRVGPGQEGLSLEIRF